VKLLQVGVSDLRSVEIQRCSLVNPFEVLQAAVGDFGA